MGLAGLNYLDLNLNNISRIDVGTFKYLTRLAHLIISNNPIIVLTTLDFYGTNLQYVDLSKVGLTKVPKKLARNIRDFRLSYNNITSIKLNDFDNFPLLGLVVLDNNQITDIDSGAFGRHEQLVRLWVNTNKLKNIPQKLPPSLSSLYLEQNSIVTINEDAFEGLFKLEQLSLKKNKLKCIEEHSFRGLAKLRALNLEKNDIEVISPKALWNLTSLQSLDLTENNIKQLGNDLFRNSGSLRMLKLSNQDHRIAMEDGAFDGLLSLQSLSVYNSEHLVRIILSSTRLLHGLKNINQINMMHNNLEFIRSDLPSFWPKLKSVAIGGNNWHCNASILWMTKWMKFTTIHFVRSSSLLCSTPRALANTPIRLLTESSFIPPPTILPLPPTSDGAGWVRITRKPTGFTDNYLKLISTKIKETVKTTLVQPTEKVTIFETSTSTSLPTSTSTEPTTLLKTSKPPTTTTTTTTTTKTTQKPKTTKIVTTPRVSSTETLPADTTLTSYQSTTASKSTTNYISTSEKVTFVSDKPTTASKPTTNYLSTSEKVTFVSDKPTTASKSTTNYLSTSEKFVEYFTTCDKEQRYKKKKKWCNAWSNNVPFDCSYHLLKPTDINFIPQAIKLYNNILAQSILAAGAKQNSTTPGALTGIEGVTETILKRDSPLQFLLVFWRASPMDGEKKLLSDPP
ncbi:Leucine-rich repeats and immunoglobulin-like domains protein 1 [Nymphon striatum]|nr:Leucine-rich repeats and immunoglobulin-like domains protein 1 [Nymphon striatum]